VIARPTLDWETIERIAIWIVLFGFIGIEVASYVFPRASDLIDLRGAVLLLAIVVALVYRYIVERLGPSHVVGLKHEDGDHVSLIDYLRNRDIEECKVFALGGIRYYSHLESSGAKVGRLRVLLRNPMEMQGAPYLCDAESIYAFRREVDTTIANLMRMQSDGDVKELNIGQYSYDPLLHFMIVDDRLLHFGYFEPDVEWSGVIVLDSYVVDDATAAGRQLIRNFIALFTATAEMCSDSLTSESGRSPARDAARLSGH